MSNTFNNILQKERIRQRPGHRTPREEFPSPGWHNLLTRYWKINVYVISLLYRYPKYSIAIIVKEFNAYRALR